MSLAMNQCIFILRNADVSIDRVQLVSAYRLQPAKVNIINRLPFFGKINMQVRTIRTTEIFQGKDLLVVLEINFCRTTYAPIRFINKCSVVLAHGYCCIHLFIHEYNWCIFLTQNSRIIILFKIKINFFIRSLLKIFLAIRIPSWRCSKRRRCVTLTRLDKCDGRVNQWISVYEKSGKEMMKPAEV